MEAVHMVVPKRGKKQLSQVSRDPLNKQWAEDKEKLGFKMLQKMGWTEGKGLGAKEDGMIDYVKTKTIKDREGLGVTVETRNNWDVNNRDLDDIFATLNAEHVTVQKESASGSDDDNNTQEVKEKTKKAANIPRHLIVQKRHKAKNARNYSETDMKAILGLRPEGYTKPKIEETPSKEFESDVHTITSSTSITDYFKKLAAQRKLDMNDNSSENQVQESSQSEPESSASSESDIEKEKKKAKKEKKRKQKEESKEEKKSKKQKKEESSDSEDSDDNRSKNKKSKKIESESEEESSSKKKSKKKSKSKTESESDVDDDKKSKKKKKSKKSKKSESDEEAEVEEKVPKKKKSKSSEDINSKKKKKSEESEEETEVKTKKSKKSKTKRDD